MKTKVKEFSVWLDAMRGLAALTVFIGHARVVLIGSIVNAVGVNAAKSPAGPGMAAGKTAEVTSFGHEAVIVFFVMSGFLVGGGALRALRSGKWSASDYAIARLSRLWTVLVPVLLLGALLDHAGMAMAGPDSIYQGPPGQQMVYADQAARMGIATFFGNVFFVQTILTTPFGSNSPLWSLSYEFWFYVAFPFLMLLLAPGTPMGRRALCLGTLGLIALFVGKAIALYFLFWLIGVLVDLAPKRLSEHTARRIATLGSAGFVVLLALLYRLKLPLALSDAIESVACGLLCYAIVHLRRELPQGWFVIISGGLAAMSYTLYVIHAPVIAFYANLVMPAWHPWPVNADGLARFAISCAFVFVVAVAMYRVFERNTPLVRQAMLRAYKGLIGKRLMI